MKSLQTFLIAVTFCCNLHVFPQSNSEILNLKKVDSLFNFLYKNDKTGAAFAIIKNGNILYKQTKGLANIPHQVAITDRTVFNIASVSKQFTSYLALMLAEEGKLSFTDDIRTHLPELAHLPYKITIKQLTNHTHGLPNIDELAGIKSVSRMTHRQIVQMALTIKQINFRPGEMYQYGNTGYVLLTAIIRRVGKKPFNTQLKERIFIPLGMKDSQAIGTASDVIKNKATSYRLVNNTYIHNPIALETMGSSGIYTTINDMIIWAKQFYKTTNGKHLYFTKMKVASELNSGEKLRYGMGLQFGVYKGLETVFHGGGTASYRSYILHVPTHGLSLVFLSNSGDFTGLDMIYKSLEIMLKKELKIKKSVKITYSNKQLQQFIGTYEQSPANYYTIYAERNKLYFKTYGSEEKLVLPLLEKNTFTFTPLPYAKFVFSKETLNFLIGDFNYECKKINIDPPNSAHIDLSSFIGVYRNKAHRITYELVLDANQLKLKRVFNDDFILNPLTKTAFYAQGFGKLDFHYDANHRVNGFKMSGANFKNISFDKL